MSLQLFILMEEEQMRDCVYHGFLFLLVFFINLPSDAQRLNYNIHDTQQAPYIYDGVAFTEDAIQLKLFSLFDDIDGFFELLNVFLLDIDYKGQTNNSSYLIRATIIERWLFVEPLIERGIDVNLTNKWGATALMYAAFCGHAQSVQLLLEAGADPTIHSKNGTAMDSAKRGRNNATSCSTKGDYDTTMFLIRTAKIDRTLKRFHKKKFGQPTYTNIWYQN